MKQPTPDNPLGQLYMSVLHDAHEQACRLHDGYELLSEDLVPPLGTSLNVGWLTKPSAILSLLDEEEMMVIEAARFVATEDCMEIVYGDRPEGSAFVVVLRSICTLGREGFSDLQDLWIEEANTIEEPAA